MKDDVPLVPRYHCRAIVSIAQVCDCRAIVSIAQDGDPIGDAEQLRTIALLCILCDVYVPLKTRAVSVLLQLARNLGYDYS